MKIGPYSVQVTQRANCRRMILHYNRLENLLTLSVPRGTREKDVRAFLEKNLDWMHEHAGQPSQWQPSYAAGERHWAFGRLVTLGTDAPVGEKNFRAWQTAQLKRMLQRMLDKWAPAMGVKITHVTLQEMKSRWGSCRSRTGRLTFNTRLAMYEESLIEETVVHELCHFFHQNHSAAFYAEMTKWLPDWRRRKEMRDKRDVRPLPPLG